MELSRLFTNRALTTSALQHPVAERVRAGTTCRAEILAAMARLYAGGPPQWHARDVIVAEVQRVASRYPVGTIRRVLLYDLVGRSAFNHVATHEVERRSDEFRLR